MPVNKTNKPESSGNIAGKIWSLVKDGINSIVRLKINKPVYKQESTILSLDSVRTNSIDSVKKELKNSIKDFAMLQLYNHTTGGMKTFADPQMVRTLCENYFNAENDVARQAIASSHPSGIRDILKKAQLSIDNIGKENTVSVKNIVLAKKTNKKEAKVIDILRNMFSRRKISSINVDTFPLVKVPLVVTHDATDSKNKNYLIANLHNTLDKNSYDENKVLHKDIFDAIIARDKLYLEGEINAFNPEERKQYHGYLAAAKVEAVELYSAAEEAAKTGKTIFFRDDPVFEAKLNVIVKQINDNNQNVVKHPRLNK